jgi:diadenosine tetraphosphatase ApaH/serine/threonine PP2A family protein phosphatase
VRYAVVSDIHGNLEALRAVLADAAPRADDVLCLGDVVGYGADPSACVEMIGARAGAVVAGNHERAVTGGMSLSWFNRYARAAAEWTRTQLDTDCASYLTALPLTVEVDDATLVHASPRQPDEWEYLVSDEDGWQAFDAFATRLCFVGHSHVPAMWSLGSSGPDYERGDVDIRLDAGRRYIVNVGSVGQPRDRDPRAAYALWDVEARRVSIRRVAYDVAGARAKIEAAGLPRFLSERLAAGA